MKRKGIGGHQSAVMQKDEWLTPPDLLAKLGSFDLDPCSPINAPWPTAKKHYTLFDDGLKHDWTGRVWCNPPYGLEAAAWLRRCSAHGSCMALVFARTETEMFFKHVWGTATAILFIKGRLHFHHIDGSRAKANAGAPSVLIAYDEPNASILQASGIAGKFLQLK